MVLKIDWSTPIIPKDIIMQIQPPDLEDFYLELVLCLFDIILSLLRRQKY